MKTWIETAQQGTTEWLEARKGRCNASDLARAMGIDPNGRSRNSLIKAMATGIDEEFSDYVQERVINPGHAIEAQARVIVERRMKVELYPTVIAGETEGITLGASLDGLTDDTFGPLIDFECKRRNAELWASMLRGVIPREYHPQMEQGLWLSGADECIFAVSDATEEGTICATYRSNPELRAKIVPTWKQVLLDVAAYVPAPIAAEVIGNEPGTLPAVFVQVEGRVVAGDMLAHRAMVSDWVKRLPARFETDQDFSDGVAAVKACEKAEGDLKALAQQVRGQMATVDEVFRLIEDATKEISTARLRIDKSVKAEKDRKRLDEVTRGRNSFAAHWRELNERVGGMMPGVQAGAWGEAIKGLKTIASIREAIDAELARAKIEANAISDRIQSNKEAAADCMHLFPDFGQVCQKDPADFSNLLAARKAEADRREADRMEAERARIRAEEHARAERESQAKAKAEQDARDAETARQRAIEQERFRQERAAELARIDADQKEAIRVALEAQRAEQEKAAAIVAPAPVLSDKHVADANAAAFVDSIPDTGATMKLGEICERLGFTITAQFLAGIGFEPVGHERAAKLYRECDFRAICIAMVKHITALYQPTSKE